MHLCKKQRILAKSFISLSRNKFCKFTEYKYLVDETFILNLRELVLYNDFRHPHNCHELLAVFSKVCSS